MPKPSVKRNGPSSTLLSSCISSNFNSLWPSDAIWWHRSGLTLAQLMACCLMALNHYLSQFWLKIIDIGSTLVQFHRKCERYASKNYHLEDFLCMIYHGTMSMGSLSPDPSHISHNALHEYPTMQHFVTEMCTHVHISVTNWCIVAYYTGALRDLCNRSNRPECCILM